MFKGLFKADCIDRPLFKKVFYIIYIYININNAQTNNKFINVIFRENALH